MNSSRPYLIRAIYEWIVDNDATPYMIVNASYEGTSLPSEYVDENNQIILNISPSACIHLDLGMVEISFNARFGGRSTDIIVPIGAVEGIFARENGQGMIFGDEPGDKPTPPTGTGAANHADTNKPALPDFLKVVK